MLELNAYAAELSSQIGFYGASPAVQRDSANQAASTDFASVVTLANNLRAALVQKEFIKGVT